MRLIHLPLHPPPPLNFPLTSPFLPISLPFYPLPPSSLLSPYPPLSFLLFSFLPPSSPFPFSFPLPVRQAFCHRATYSAPTILLSEDSLLEPSLTQSPAHWLFRDFQVVGLVATLGVCEYRSDQVVESLPMKRNHIEGRGREAEKLPWLLLLGLSALLGANYPR